MDALALWHFAAIVHGRNFVARIYSPREVERQLAASRENVRPSISPDFFHAINANRSFGSEAL